MHASDRANKVAARFGATSFGRSPETWRRRDSFLLVGLLLLVDYLLVAILLVVHLNALGRVALVAGTVPILASTIAEAVHAFRPTQGSLARADRLALIAVGTAAAISAVVIVAGLAAGQFD